MTEPASASAQISHQLSMGPERWSSRSKVTCTLAQAITRLLRDPDLRCEMGRAGRERVQQHFSVEKMVQQTQSLYEQLLVEKSL